MTYWPVLDWSSVYGDLLINADIHYTVVIMSLLLDLPMIGFVTSEPTIAYHRTIHLSCFHLTSLSPALRRV